MDCLRLDPWIPQESLVELAIQYRCLCPTLTACLKRNPMIIVFKSSPQSNPEGLLGLGTTAHRSNTVSKSKRKHCSVCVLPICLSCQPDTLLLPGEESKRRVAFSMCAYSHLVLFQKPFRVHYQQMGKYGTS